MLELNGGLGVLTCTLYLDDSTNTKALVLNLHTFMEETITFLPYGATVDEFQHIIYENPDLTIDERKKVWRDLEKKYTPYKVYDDPFFEEGNFWIRQGHIFSTAFYYIDYTLAQNCAHQFLIKQCKYSTVKSAFASLALSALKRRCCCI